MFFFFSSRRRHTRSTRDWSSDVCSSDLRLLTNDVPTGVRNRAWFYLAQVWYARGYLDRAEEALRKVNGKLSPELEAEKQHLFANVLMHQGRYDEAIRLLTGWHGAQDWTASARFN